MRPGANGSFITLDDGKRKPVSSPDHKGDWLYLSMNLCKNRKARPEQGRADEGRADQ